VKKKNSIRLFGIFGYPLGHTLSPAFQEAALEKIGLKGYYLSLELKPASFKKVMRGLRGTRFSLDGFNVTVPYKETVIPYVSRLSKEARQLGAVNTVVRKGSRWLGLNTDFSGFLTSLRQDAHFRARGKRVLVLGAGGSARAVVYGLAKSGARQIHVANRHPDRAKRLIRKIKPYFKRTHFSTSSLKSRETKEGVQSADLVVNCTSLGLKKGKGAAIPQKWIPKANRGRRVFYDLVYQPAETPFLKAAKRHGHRAVNGLGMLLHQGAEAFGVWTGRKPPLSVMRKALREALK